MRPRYLVAESPWGLVQKKFPTERVRGGRLMDNNGSAHDSADGYAGRRHSNTAAAGTTGS